MEIGIYSWTRIWMLPMEPSARNCLEITSCGRDRNPLLVVLVDYENKSRLVDLVYVQLCIHMLCRFDFLTISMLNPVCARACLLRMLSNMPMIVPCMIVLSS